MKALIGEVKLGMNNYEKDSQYDNETNNNSIDSISIDSSNDEMYP